MSVGVIACSFTPTPLVQPPGRYVYPLPTLLSFLAPSYHPLFLSLSLSSCVRVGCSPARKKSTICLFVSCTVLCVLCSFSCYALLCRVFLERSPRVFSLSLSFSYPNLLSPTIAAAWYWTRCPMSGIDVSLLFLPIFFAFCFSFVLSGDCAWCVTLCDSKGFCWPLFFPTSKIAFLHCCRPIVFSHSTCCCCIAFLYINLLYVFS